MLIKLFQWMLSLALLAAVASILVISSGYIILKSNLPEINLNSEMIEVTGLLRKIYKPNMFKPENDIKNNIWFKLINTSSKLIVWF